VPYRTPPEWVTVHASDMSGGRLTITVMAHRLEGFTKRLERLKWHVRMVCPANEEETLVAMNRIYANTLETYRYTARQLAYSRLSPHRRAKIALERAAMGLPPMDAKPCLQE
jgi:hypothetical protein